MLSSNSPSPSMRPPPNPLTSTNTGDTYPLTQHTETTIPVVYICSGHQLSQTFHYYLTRRPQGSPGYGKVIALFDHTAKQVQHTVDVMLRRCVDYSRCDEIVLPSTDAHAALSQMSDVDVMLSNVPTHHLVKVVGIMPVKDLTVVVPMEGTLPSQRRMYCGIAPRHFYMAPAAGYSGDLEHRVRQWQEVRALERELRIVQGEYDRQCAEAYHNERVLKEEIERLERQVAQRVHPTRLLEGSSPSRYYPDPQPRLMPEYPHIGPITLSTSPVVNVNNSQNVSPYVHRTASYDSPASQLYQKHLRLGVRTPHM
eukprot:PhF_6_TR7267/c0_g1_i1/m.10841